MKVLVVLLSGVVLFMLGYVFYGLSPDAPPGSPPLAAVPPTAAPAMPAETPVPAGGLSPAVSPTSMFSSPVPMAPPAHTADRSVGSVITSLGQQVSVTVTGFGDNPLRFEQLVSLIDEVEQMLGVP